MIKNLKIKTALSYGLLLAALVPVTSALTANNAHALIDSKVQSLAPMVQKVIPSVVSITVTSSKKVQSSGIPNTGLPFNLDEFFKNIPGFEANNGQTQKVVSAGSGVITDSKNGYILTNAHVVAGAETIVISTNDGRSFTAKNIGSDPETDIAVLKIQGNFSNLKQIDIGNSQNLEIGDYVVAVGNPFGIGLTVTSGIVSALNRSIDANNYENLIQTDAAINHGNSGGALVTLDGKLVGINSLILSGQNSSGLGFAIPSNQAMNIYTQLITTGKITRAYLGIYGNSLTPNIVKSLKLPIHQGAFISEVLPNTPADKAQLKSGDIVIEANKVKIVSFPQLRTFVSSLLPKSKLELKVIRNNKEITLQVTLDTRDGKNTDYAPATEVTEFMGLAIVENNNKLVVKDVAKGSFLDNGRIKKGDNIISINNTVLKNKKDLAQFLKDNDKETSFIFLLERNNSKFYLIINR